MAANDDDKFTGQNRAAAKFLGVPAERFVDPGFCLGCGEAECECEPPTAEQAFDRWNPNEEE